MSNLGPSAFSEQKISHLKSWRVFGNNRTLFVPVANGAVQNYALNFFISNKWQRFAVGLAAKLGLGRKISSGISVVSQEITDLLAFADNISNNDNAKNISAEQVFYAIRQGSKGPYQKTSLIAINQSGQPQFYAKVAVLASADAMVEAESACLQRLSLIHSLKDMVPKRLSFGKTPSGRVFFTTTVASTLQTNKRFQSQHEKFLSTLGHATIRWCQYANSSEAQFAQSALERLKQALGSGAHNNLVLAAQDILTNIGELNLPAVMAHRDFAPWNIRWHLSSIFVFDWEYAAEGANPLYDFFHFHLIQHVLSHRLNTNLSDYSLHVVPAALAYIRQYYPEVDWNVHLVRSLMLTYMVDLVLFYVDSASIFDLNHPVISQYYQMIISRSRWL